MRVLVATNMYPGRDKNFDYKGVFVKEQVDELRAIGLDVDVYAIDGHKGYFHYVIGAWVLFFKYFFGRYDVIHCHYGLSALFTCIIPFFKWRKVVLTLHGGDILEEQGKSTQVFLTKLVLPRVSRVVVLNDEMVKVVSKYNSNYTVLVCGADSDLFNGTFSNVRKKIALFPGRKEREVKNYPLFSKILTEYRSLGGDIEEIVIDGFSREEVSMLLKDSALLLMTSISEGSPQIVKEAMLSDICVISSDVGDVSKVLDKTLGTMVFDTSISPQEISANIDSIIDEAAKSPGQRRKRIFDLGLDQRTVINNLLNVYKEVCGD